MKRRINAPSSGCLLLSTESTGLLLLLLSAILYSVAGIFVKFAADTGLASSELVLLRAVFQGTLVISGLCCSRSDSSSDDDDDDDNDDAKRIQQQQQKGKGQRLIWQPFGATRRIQKVVILRGMIGATGFCLFFYTISTLPLGDATALVALKPVPTIFLGYLILGEPIKSLHVVVTVMSVVGSIGIAQPSFLFQNIALTDEVQQHSSWGHVTGLLGACCAAGVVILIRKAGSIGAHTLQLLFSWSFFSIIFSSILLWDKWKLPQSVESWLYVLALSVIGAAAHFLLNFAARLAPASLTSIVRSSDLMFAYAWEMIIFHEVPNAWTCMGVALIALSLILIAVHKIREMQGEPQQHDPQEEDGDEEQQILKSLPSRVQRDDSSETFDMDNEEDEILCEKGLASELELSKVDTGYAKVSVSESD